MPLGVTSSHRRHPYARRLAVVCVLFTTAVVSPRGNAVGLSAVTNARPVSLACDDFDGDGIRDLACGSATDDGGLVTIARGNGAGISGPARVSAEPPPPFFASIARVTLPLTPSLLVAGDFDNDGRRDLVAGAVGDDRLFLLAGDGHGNLSGPSPFALPGRLTALAAGDVDRIDGLADLLVGVDGSAGPRLLVFEGPSGAIRATPEVVATTAPVEAIVVGQFDADAPVDVAAASGSDLVVVHGRNRPLFAGGAGARLAPQPSVDVIATGAPVRETKLRALASTRPSVSLEGRDVVASIPMRLNGDAVDDFAIVEAGANAPTFVLSKAASTFSVTTTADDGPGSLRAAIDLANASPGSDLISFNIAGGGVRTIQPLTPLPDITDPVTIDATTQTGFSGMPLVELDGVLLDENAIGLHVLAGSSVVRGLVVDRFAGSADDGVGIMLETGGGNIVEGNFLGVDPTGTADRANGDYDVYVYQSAANLIGGTIAAARNVIAGSVAGACVEIVYSDLASDNLIKGNFIGTDVTGTMDLNAVSNGVFLGGGPNCVVGGTEPGARNVISGNGGDFNGANVAIQGVHNNLVQGNSIGTDPTGTNPVATSQAHAILIDGEAMDNTIGGTAAGAANRIAFDAYGVDIGEYRGDSTGNAILGNAISHHDHIGIGLGYDDVTPNDGDDADTGSNDFQNFPVLTSATRSGDTVELVGRLAGAANASYRVELFGNTTCNPFGFGEGETYVGFVDVSTDGSGIATFSKSLEASDGVGTSFTATATDSAGNTSEFSMCVELTLSWQSPDPNATDMFPPPRNLAAEAVTPGVGSSSRDNPILMRRPSDGVTQYNVYSSTSPGVEPSSDTFLTSVPATQTAATGSVFVGGSFFVVTAMYPTGESDPSNEVETGTPPTIASVKAKAIKVTGKGSGFTTDSVLVTVDGIPFRSAAVVKNGGKKVVQSGVLITGESVLEYARGRPGGIVSVLFRNSTGGVDGRRVKVAGT